MRTFALRTLSALALVSIAGCVGAPAAPVAYYAPQQGQRVQAPVQQIAYGSHCSAGFYQCPLAQSLPVGSQCSCPGIGAPSFGVVQ